MIYKSIENRLKLFILIGFVVITSFTLIFIHNNKPNASSYDDKPKPKRICYLLSQSNDVIIPVEHLIYSLCTHWIFAFAKLDNYTIIVNEFMNNYIQQVMSNVSNQSETNFLISIGTDEMTLVDNPEEVERFIDSVIKFMDKYRLDGVDIDWEFPMSKKLQFSRLLRRIHDRFQRKLNHRHRKYLLSIAISPVISIVEQCYDLHSINFLVDFVNVMTYDYHSPNTFPYTNFNAPLYANHLDLLYFQYFNIHFSINYLRQLGLRKELMMVGIPFYGYKYYLVNPNFHNLYALSNGTEVPVKFNEICNDFLVDPRTQIIMDHESKVPYAYRSLEWITYDNSESIAIKAQWIVDNNLGGSMSFPLNFDDFTGDYCTKINEFQRKYPLQSIIGDILN